MVKMYRYYGFQRVLQSVVYCFGCEEKEGSRFQNLPVSKVLNFDLAKIS